MSFSNRDRGHINITVHILLKKRIKSITLDIQSNIHQRKLKINLILFNSSNYFYSITIKIDENS